MMNCTRVFVPLNKCILHSSMKRLKLWNSKRFLQNDLGPKLARSSIFKLRSRNLVQVQGKDTFDFLQGLVTNDVHLLSNMNVCQYSMMLNVQGRVLYDLILYNMSKNAETPKLWIECAKDIKEDLIQIMKKYKIRKKVEIIDISSFTHVYSAKNLSDHDLNNIVIDMLVEDPRLPELGKRILTSEDLTSKCASFCEENEKEYHEYRYQLGVGEGITDLPPGNCFPLESNLIFLKGVSFNKGCYIGQELTARTYHTGVTRKRLMPLVFEMSPSESINLDSVIFSENGKSVGKLRNCINGYGLGLMRVAQSQGALTINQSGGVKLALKAVIPSWWPCENHML